LRVARRTEDPATRRSDGHRRSNLRVYRRHRGRGPRSSPLPAGGDRCSRCRARVAGQRGLQNRAICRRRDGRVRRAAGHPAARPRCRGGPARSRGARQVAGDIDEFRPAARRRNALGQATGELNARGFYLSQAFPNARLRGGLGSVEPFLADYVTSTTGSMICARPLATSRQWHAGKRRARGREARRVAVEGFVSLSRDSTWPECVGTSRGCVRDPASGVRRADLRAAQRRVGCPNRHIGDVRCYGR